MSIVVNHAQKPAPGGTNHEYTPAGFLNISTILQNDLFYESALAQTVRLGDELGTREMMIMRYWGQQGAQSVQIPHTYAAALMATDVRDSLRGHSLPWPCFMIHVPAGLLRSSHGEVNSVLVSDLPPRLQGRGKMARAKYITCYLDGVSAGFNAFESLETILDSDIKKQDNFVAEGLVDLYDEDTEVRLWNMLLRLTAGVILTINTARIDKPEAYPKRPPRMKRDVLRANEHKVGHVLTIDCRQSIRDYVSGNSRNSPSVTTLVRGHWRNQPYGPQKSLRRAQFIQPFYRGEGPMLVRPVHVKPPETAGT